jgi:hypothetical protein
MQYNKQHHALLCTIEAGKRYIEFRFTCKKASGTNKVAFYFHGGRMIFHEDKFFASFRPLPWLKDKNGDPRLNPDGSRQTGSVWAKIVSTPIFNLTAEETVFLQTVQQHPELLALAPIAVKEAFNCEAVYQDFDLQTWIHSFSEGMDNVKFTFNVSPQFKPVMESLKNLVDSTDSHYSLVMRFNLDEPIYGLSELQEEYGSDELFKSFPLKPTYVGFIEGISKEDLPKSSFINPALINDAADAAIQAALVKKEEYLNLDYLKLQAASMKEKLDQIGRGKKAHLETLNELNDAAEAGNTEAFKDASTVLLAIANRGENPHLPVEKAESYIETAKASLVEKGASVDILDNLFD